MIPLTLSTKQTAEAAQTISFKEKKKSSRTTVFPLNRARQGPEWDQERKTAACAASKFFSQSFSDSESDGDSLVNPRSQSYNMSSAAASDDNEDLFDRSAGTGNEENYDGEALCVTKKTLTCSQQILDIRFSQDSVSIESRDGINLTDAIRTHGWEKKSSIRVITMPDGTLTALDNRRLLAMKTIAHEYLDAKKILAKLQPNVEIIPHKMECRPQDLKNEIARNREDTPEAALVEEKQKDLGIQDGTYGALVWWRMRGNVSIDHFGFTEPPKEIPSKN